MPSLSEIKYAALAERTGLTSGTLNELEYTTLFTDTGVAGLTLNEQWMLALKNRGYEGNLNERQMDYWGDLGYTGSWNERARQYFEHLNDGGAPGETFPALHSEHTQYLVIVYVSEHIASTTGAGFTMTVDGTPYPLTMQGFGAQNITFITQQIPIGGVALVSYSGGDTVSTFGSDLADFSDMESKAGLATFAFAHAGSYHLFSDGVTKDHVLRDLAAGVGSVSYINDPISMPDWEGNYHLNRAGDPPWYGARKDNTDPDNPVWYDDEYPGGPVIDPYPKLFAGPVGTFTTPLGDVELTSDSYWTVPIENYVDGSVWYGEIIMLVDQNGAATNYPAGLIGYNTTQNTSCLRVRNNGFSYRTMDGSDVASRTDFVIGELIKVGSMAQNLLSGQEQVCLNAEWTDAGADVVDWVANSPELMIPCQERGNTFLKPAAPALYGNVRRYELPHSQAVVKIDSLMSDPTIITVGHEINVVYGYSSAPPPFGLLVQGGVFAGENLTRIAVAETSGDLVEVRFGADQPAGIDSIRVVSGGFAVVLEWDGGHGDYRGVSAAFTNYIESNDGQDITLFFSDVTDPVEPDSTIYVAPDGSDSAPGTELQPIQTADEARERVQAEKAAHGLGDGIDVIFRAGEYPQTASLPLTAADSGEAGAVVTWKAYPGETALIHGAEELDPAWFTLMTSGDSEWSRLPAAAQNNVYKCDLGAQGIADYGTLRVRGFLTKAIGAAELFVNNQRATLSRWPKDDNNRALTGVVQTTSSFNAPVGSDLETRMANWTADPDKWAHGQWWYAWSDEHIDITISGSTITLSKAPRSGLREDRPFYVYNLLSEIGLGEWYLERGTGILYYWPDGDILTQDLKLSMLETPVITTDAASHITFDGLEMGIGRQHIITVTDGGHITLDGCEIHGSGNDGAQVTGDDHSVVDCHFHDSGNSALNQDSGDMTNLVSGNFLCQNNLIERAQRWDWTTAEAIMLNGVAGQYLNNEIKDMPGQAMWVQGARYLIQNNEVYDVCQQGADMAAVYIVGNWCFRGYFYNNYIHDIQTNYLDSYDVSGVYPDDWCSGVEVIGNYFIDIDNYGIFHAGGRDMIMENNLQVRCGTSHHSDCRGWEYGADGLPGHEYHTKMTNVGVSYRTEPWLSAYPELAALPPTMPELALDHWSEIEGCVYSRNLSWDFTRFYIVTTQYGCPTPVMDQMDEVINNIEDEDPLFVDEAGGDLNLQAGSPAYTSIPGWQEIDFDAMGRQ